MAAEPLGVWTDRRAEPFGAVPVPAANPRFEALYREHFDRLRRFCLGMTGQPTLAEDIAQETLLRAYVRMERLDVDRPLWPWLKKVATRLVYDHARANREVCAEAPEPTATVEDGTEHLAERDLLSRVMHRLPARQRVAVTLRYLDDWKPAEVAELLNLERPAVEQLLLRARRSLCAEYRRLGGDRMRVALWPLVGLLHRLRDRAARLAAAAGELSASTVAVAADTMSILVVATAITMSAGMGVASAAMLDRGPAEVTAPQRPASPRILAATTVDTPPIAAITRRRLLAATDVASAAQRRPGAQAPRLDNPSAPAPSSAVSVAVAPPAQTDAATPEAAAKVERTPEKTMFNGTLRAPVNGGPGDALGTAPHGQLECNTDTRRAVCDASQQVIEATEPELPADL